MKLTPVAAVTLSLAAVAALSGQQPQKPTFTSRTDVVTLDVGGAEIAAPFSPEQHHRLETALSQAGVDYTIDTYTGARHGFAVTGHLVYDRDSSERHWQRLLHLLRETLQTRLS